MQVNIKNLIDDVQCYQTVRELRWPDGIDCPSCESKEVIKRGFDDTEPARQRYECHDCHKRFDDLTDTIFAGHHQPLKVWLLCLYLMGLNLCIGNSKGILAPGPRAHNPAHRSFRAPRRPSRSSWCQRAAAGRALPDAAEPRRRGRF